MEIVSVRLTGSRGDVANIEQSLRMLEVVQD